MAFQNKLCVVVNGMATSGKDTFCEFASKHLNNQYNLSSDNITSIGEVMEIALAAGWDGVKDAKGRKFLSDIKDASTEYNDGPFKYITRSVFNKNVELIFVHIREPQEIQKVVRWCADNSIYCETIRVTTNRVPIVDNNTGDLGAMQDYAYTANVSNDSSLDDFETKARSMVTIWVDQYELLKNK